MWCMNKNKIFFRIMLVWLAATFGILFAGIFARNIIGISIGLMSGMLWIVGVAIYNRHLQKLAEDLLKMAEEKEKSIQAVAKQQIEKQMSDQTTSRPHKVQVLSDEETKDEVLNIVNLMDMMGFTSHLIVMCDKGDKCIMSCGGDKDKVMNAMISSSFVRNMCKIVAINAALNEINGIDQEEERF